MPLGSSSSAMYAKCHTLDFAHLRERSPAVVVNIDATSSLTLALRSRSSVTILSLLAARPAKSAFISSVTILSTTAFILA